MNAIKLFLILWHFLLKELKDRFKECETIEEFRYVLDEFEKLEFCE